jgi:hypothetical protein
VIRLGRGYKEEKIPLEWLRGSWLLFILEAGFGIKIGPGGDLEIEASMSTVDIYAKADTLEELVQRSMMFEKLYCPDYTEEEVRKG